VKTEALSTEGHAAHFLRSAIESLRTGHNRLTREERLALLAHVDSKQPAEPPAQPMSPEAEAERVQNKWHSLVEVMETIKDPWTWVWNMRCKYLGLRIDTRTLDCVITDRYGTTITLEELKFQQGGGYARFSGTKAGGRVGVDIDGNGKPLRDDTKGAGAGW
jgi:hypothetical protein